MENKKEMTVCRCCLKLISKNSSVTLMDNERHMLEFVFPNVRTSAVYDSKICQECLENMQSSYTFKFMCTENNRRENELVNHEKSLNTTSQNNISVKVEVAEKCPLCYEIAVGQLNSMKGNEFLQIMLKKFLPEQASYFTSTAICKKCVNCLKVLFNFCNTCVDTEEYLRKYKSVSDHTEKLNLYEVYMSKNSVLKKETFYHIDSTEVDDKFSLVKIEPKSEDCKEFLCDSLLSIEKEETKLDEELEPKSEDWMQDDHFLSQENMEGDIKDHTVCKDAISHKSFVPPDQEPVRNCKIYSSEAKTEKDPRNDFTTNESLSQTTVLNCKMCTFKTRYKPSLAGHMLTHKVGPEVATYKCDKCTYETRYKRSFNDHVLTHKHVLKAVIYKCEMCPYVTKDKYYLKVHVLIHKSPSELTTYKCAECSFQTIHKKYLKTHWLTHRKASEIMMYKCEHCTFETKRKTSLSQHKLIHKNSSELTMYKCATCSYETVRKRALSSHMVTHNKETKYKCDICSYEAKRKHHLTRHRLIHEEPSLMSTLKCGECPYETTNRRRFNAHLVTHSVAGGSNAEIRH